MYLHNYHVFILFYYNKMLAKFIVSMILKKTKKITKKIWTKTLPRTLIILSNFLMPKILCQLTRIQDRQPQLPQELVPQPLDPHLLIQHLELPFLIRKQYILTLLLPTKKHLPVWLI